MTALITGGTSGIGKEIAILLSQKGYDLLLVSRQTNDLGEIRKACHTQVDFLSLDLTKEGGLREKPGALIMMVPHPYG